MKINEYYRDTANLSLNGSIAALFPAILIIGWNLSFFQSEKMMLWTIPFLVYSIISFQIYLFKMKWSFMIEKNMLKTESVYQSTFDTKHLLIVYQNSQSPLLQLFFPDGYLAGVIKKYRGDRKRFFSFSRIYALYNFHGRIIGYFHIKRKKLIKIDVYNQNKVYLGCYEKKRLNWRKNKEEFLDASGRFLGTIDGSTSFMDEQILDSVSHQVGRLRKGWMPLSWSSFFPEPNTPVLSFRDGLLEEDKLLRMSLLINEYFIER